MTPQNKVHSSAYYLMMAIAVVVGIALGIGIFVWISMNATSRVRIPVYLLILPTILLVGLVRFIDGALVKRRQTSSGLGNQDMAPLASPYGQPDTSVEYGRPPQVGGPAPYGQAQQPMPGSSRLRPGPTDGPSRRRLRPGAADRRTGSRRLRPGAADQHHRAHLRPGTADGPSRPRLRPGAADQHHRAHLRPGTAARSRQWLGLWPTGHRLQPDASDGRAVALRSERIADRLSPATSWAPNENRFAPGSSTTDSDRTQDGLGGACGPT